MKPKTMQKAALILFLHDTDMKIGSAQGKLRDFGLEGSEVFKKLQEASDAIDAFEAD